MAGPQLTDTAVAGLRTKLDQVVSRMVADGMDDATIQAVVDDFKGRHFPQPEAERPSLLSLGGTALGQAAKSLVSAPINLARSVGGAVAEGMGGGPMGVGMSLARRLVVDPAIAQGRKALDAGREGRYSEAVGHGLAAAIPMVGPAAAHVGEQLGTGDPETMARGVGDAMAMAAAPAVMRTTGRLVQRGGEALRSGGESAFLRAAKIPESITKRTEAYRRTGSLPAGEAEIASTVLSRGRGGISRQNAQALASERGASVEAIGQAVDDIPGTMSPVPVLRAMANEVRKLRKESDPSAGAAAARYREMRNQWSEQAPMVRPSGPVMATRAPQNAAEASVEGFGQYQPIAITTRQRPRDLTAREVQDFNVAAGQRNAARYAQRGEPVSPGAARVDMAGSAAGRELLKSKSGQLRAASNRVARLTPASRAMAKAEQRAGHHDPIGLTQAVLGAGGAMTMGPAGALMALLPVLQRAGPLSRLGQGMYNAGGRASAAGGVMSQATMEALLAQLLSEGQDGMEE